MIKDLCKPYRECNLQQLTQGWSESHRAFDFGAKYGTWLVAMENCIVENIMTAENWDTGWELERGYGILLRSIKNPEIKYSYWHCLPFFCVKKGDTVLMGQPIGQMGNSGFVLSNGQPVLIKDRLKPPYPGTHVHLAAPQDTLDHIDWNKDIKFDLLTAISVALQNIINFIK